MKKLLLMTLLMVLVCNFTACQRYPYLSYYIVVVDKDGNNLLTDSAQEGMINVGDVWFERHGAGVNDTSFVISVEADTADAACYASYQRHYDPKHIQVDASARIGVHLDECPLLIAHWPDGSVDSMKIDNANGTMGNPKYYINGKRVKCFDNDMIVITK